MQAWQSIRRKTDGPGDGFDGQIAERIGAEFGRHVGLDFVRERLALEEVRGEEFADRRHVDAVETGRR